MKASNCPIETKLQPIHTTFMTKRSNIENKENFCSCRKIQLLGKFDLLVGNLHQILKAYDHADSSVEAFCEGKILLLHFPEISSPLFFLNTSEIIPTDKHGNFHVEKMRSDVPFFCRSLTLRLTNLVFSSTFTWKFAKIKVFVTANLK